MTLSLWPHLSPSPFRASAESIVRGVAEDHLLTLDELRSPTRVRPVAWARQEAMARLRAERDAGGGHRFSLTWIARFLKLEDHTTVLHGIRAFERRRGQAE